MKKVLVFAAIAVVVIGMAGIAFATTTATSGDVTVNATVSSGCTGIQAGTVALAIDPLVAGDVNSAGGANTKTMVQCVPRSGGYTVAVTADGGTTNGAGGTLDGTLKGLGGQSPIPYALTYSATFNGSGIGANKNVTLVDIGGVKVLAANVAVAEYGSFSDTVTMTVSY